MPPSTAPHRGYSADAGSQPAIPSQIARTCFFRKKNYPIAMRFTFLTLASLFLISCGGSNQVAERRAVPPPGSDGDMPWTVPIEGQGGGPLSGILERR